MSFYPSLPARAHLEHLFQAHPKGVKPLLQLHDALLRADSQLSVGERELLAAFVSSLNACEFCFGAHRTMAMAFGVSAELIDALIKDIETAPIDDNFRPLLRYAAKVTHREGITQQDAKAVFEAGWDEAILHDVLMITCLYNFMNRLVDGAGLSAKLSYEKPLENDLKERREGTYTQWGEDAGFFKKG